MQVNPRDVKPFRQGDSLSASKFEALRKGVAKRIRGLLGRESATSVSTTPSSQSLRERVEVYSEAEVDEYSLFAVKKSKEFDYPWEMNLRFELNKFEFGFTYATNLDFPMYPTTSTWCEIVGDLPVLVRYNAQDGEPKVGHPIGPLEDGSVSIKRCGFVVHAEPDTENERVWVVRSNDQVIRVKLREDIKRRERGEACVLGTPPELECDGCTRDTAPGQYEEEGCEVKDPNSVDSLPGFVLREILNLSKTDLEENDIVYIHPVLGVGYCILSTEPGQYKAKVVQGDQHHFPDHEDSPHCCKLMVFDTESEDWVEAEEDGSLRIGVWDRNSDNCVLINEMHDVMPTYDNRGCAYWHWVGQHGLTREMKATANIAVGQSGAADVYEHLSEGSCAASNTGATVNVCNKGKEEIKAGDIIIAHWVEKTWITIGAGNSFTEIIGQLTQKMCPGDAVGQVLITEIIGETVTGFEVGKTVSADNLFSLAGAAGLRVLMGLHEGQGEEQVAFIKQVQHVGIDVVTPSTEQQDDDVGSFLRYKDCAVDGHLLRNVATMSCGPAEWDEQIALQTRYYLDSASFGRTSDDCNYALTGYYNSFCSFGEDEGSTPSILGATSFQILEMFDELELEYDGGDSTDTCAEQAEYTYIGGEWTLTTACAAGCTVDPDYVFPENPNELEIVFIDCLKPNKCEDPKLLLKGKKRAVLACDDCNENNPQPETGSRCRGTVDYVWVPVTGQLPAFPFVGQWQASGLGISPGVSVSCSCANCEAPIPTHDPNLAVTPEFRVTVDCTCKTEDNPCCEEEPTNVAPDVSCKVEVISELPLAETTAYYDKDITGGCFSLIPHSFVVFKSSPGEADEGQCDLGDAEEILCVNPCPTDTSSA